MDIKDILDGISAANSQLELDIHIDRINSVFESGELSVSLGQRFDIDLAIIEVRENNFKRWLH